MRNHLPDLGALLCLMGHLYRGSGDSKRAMDTYIEALKVNPYLWEAFDGLIELGIFVPVSKAHEARCLASNGKLFQSEFYDARPS
jgi:anaphase-promoting complex subunit 3